MGVSLGVASFVGILIIGKKNILEFLKHPMRNPARIGHFRCKSLLKSSGADATAAKRQAILDLNTEEQDD